MEPVRTVDCNVVYKGPTQDIGDLWCRRINPGLIRTTWEPTEEERRMLAEGGRVQLSIYHEPIPPVQLSVVAAQDSEPVGPHDWKIDVNPGDKLNPLTEDQAGAELEPLIDKEEPDGGNTADAAEATSNSGL